jgi:hypothetical protein
MQGSADTKVPLAPTAAIATIKTSTNIEQFRVFENTWFNSNHQLTTTRSYLITRMDESSSTTKTTQKHQQHEKHHNHTPPKQTLEAPPEYQRIL